MVQIQWCALRSHIQIESSHHNVLNLNPVSAFLLYLYSATFVLSLSLTSVKNSFIKLSSWQRRNRRCWHTQTNHECWSVHIMKFCTWVILTSLRSYTTEVLIVLKCIHLLDIYCLLIYCLYFSPSWHPSKPGSIVNKLVLFLSVCPCWDRNLNEL